MPRKREPLYKTPDLRPEVLELVKERKFLESKKYDVSKFEYPDTHWEFYDTFLESDMTQLGISKGVPTTADIEGDLVKYHKKAVAIRAEALKPIIIPKEEPPEPFRTLVLLVGADGRWNNSRAVMKCLSLPVQAKLTSTTIEWEEATAFALAAMRQKVELFYLLADVYERASEWLTNVLVLYEAKRMLNEWEGVPDDPAALAQQKAIDAAKHALQSVSTATSRREAAGRGVGDTGEGGEEGDTFPVPTTAKVDSTTTTTLGGDGGGLGATGSSWVFLTVTDTIID